MYVFGYVVYVCVVCNNILACSWVVLCICRCSLVLYSAGSGVKCANYFDRVEHEVVIFCPCV